MAPLLLFFLIGSWVPLIQSKCYEELGCFYNEYPWTSALRPALQAVSPVEINTTFYIQNREHVFRQLKSSIPIQVWPKVDLKANYDAKKPTFIITHGYRSNVRVRWSLNLTQAILSKVDGNVILVDWNKGSMYNYLTCLSNIRIVAAEITRLIKILIKHHSADVSSFHLLGHSLGAHIMSYVGKSIAGIARITALDPARPGFQGRHPAVRLHSGDARFVDVLHTDGRPLLGLGMSVSAGHVDFYFNGIGRQPLCASFKSLSDLKMLLNLRKVTMDLIYNLAVCSHERAPIYMAVAIEKCRMWARPYTSPLKSIIKSLFYTDTKPCTYKACTTVGLDTPMYAKMGNFIVQTKGEYPYCAKI